MCNRYTLIDPDSAFAEIARILGIPLEKPQWVMKRYNMGLMQLVPAVVNRGKDVEVLPMNLGYFHKGSPNMIANARSETLYEKRSFKTAVVSHRCALPTTGYLEWETDEKERKYPHLFQLANGRPFALGAIWDPGYVDETKANPPNCCTVTVEANPLAAYVLDRMPVVLDENNLTRWLDPTPLSHEEFLSIARTYPADKMVEREISTFANNVKHEGEECLGPPTPRPVNPVPAKTEKRADPNQMGLGF